MSKYFAFFKISVIDVIAERETIFIWIIANGLGMAGIISIWLASNEDRIGDFTREEIISYYLFIFIIQQIIGWWVFWLVRRTIRKGELSNFLVKPVSFVAYVFFHEAANKLVGLLFRSLLPQY